MVVLVGVVVVVVVVVACVIILRIWESLLYGTAHLFGCARGAAACGVIILRIWESLLYGTAHFFRLRGARAPRRGAAR